VSEPAGHRSPVRVENRSDRVWVFGYLRMVPLLLFVGGVLLIVFVLGRGAPVQPAFGIAVILLVIVLPFTLDRTSLLDPVDYVILGDRVRVKRLAGERVWPLDRVVGVELDRPEGGGLRRGPADPAIRARDISTPPRLSGAATAGHRVRRPGGHRVGDRLQHPHVGTGHVSCRARSGSTTG
jgi:hypothetical protein